MPALPSSKNALQYANAQMHRRLCHSVDLFFPVIYDDFRQNTAGGMSSESTYNDFIRAVSFDLADRRAKLTTVH
jgi:hypothetical protein